MKKEGLVEKSGAAVWDDGPFALLYGDLPGAHCIARTGSSPGPGERCCPGIHGAGAGFKL